MKYFNDNKILLLNANLYYCIVNVYNREWEINGYIVKYDIQIIPIAYSTNVFIPSFFVSSYFSFSLFLCLY